MKSTVPFLPENPTKTTKQLEARQFEIRYHTAKHSPDIVFHQKTLNLAPYPRSFPSAFRGVAGKKCMFQCFNTPTSVTLYILADSPLEKVVLDWKSILVKTPKKYAYLRRNIQRPQSFPPYKLKVSIRLSSMACF
ncbi:hypothetical protein Fot_13315 [Forsythia ovata]|uniref:Uncharacterized protein n=1 Tax=Forsythia ovata TaxID=205694 RepID=A0ABD1W3F1_9LAMI